MASLYSIDIGSTYNLVLLAPSVLGDGYSGAKAAGLFDYTTAVRMADVTGTHNKIITLLPSGTPTDASALLYYKFITSSGDTVILAQNWIASQPTLVTGTSAVVTVSNISVNDLTRLRNALTSNGFTSISIVSQ